MNKYFLLFIAFGLSVQIYAQEIKLDCKDKPLNDLLSELRLDYELQFSYNEELLAQYKISKTQTYSSPQKAIDEILKDLPLSYEFDGEVFIIYQLEIKLESKVFHLIGKIVEVGTGEPLPFSHVAVGDYQTVTDVKGVFSFSIENDSIFEVKASHLGCYIIDTLLNAGRDHTIELTPSMVGLPEVTVTNNIVEKSAQIGDKPGLTKLNHHIANYLPGNGDNSVFNLLRLQPGVLAAGEQPNDLIIWGSPEGTSRVQFDGFTIWGLKNINDNISAVNPFLAKNVEVHRGGYDASHADLIGGIINIAGKNGNRHKPEFSFFLNNETMNTMLELPIEKKSSLLLAYRQTYYDLFSANDIATFKNYNNNAKYPLEIQHPDYIFRDLNMKYSFQGDNDDLFYISLLGAGDNFKYNANQTRPNYTNQLSTEESSRQFGGSMYYGKTWDNGHSSALKISYSALDLSFNRRLIAESNRQNISVLLSDVLTQNNINEMEAEWTNTFNFSSKHSVKTGLTWFQNNVEFKEDTLDINYVYLSSRVNRITAFGQYFLQLHRNLEVTGGLRINYPTHMPKAFVDPRLGITFNASEAIKLNASWGLYHQFLVRSSILDAYDNYHYTWSIAGYNDVPILNSEHWVVGASFAKDQWLLSINGFHKNNTGLTRYRRYRQQGEILEDVFEGESRSYGLDFYAKKDFWGHSIWMSYSLTKTEELFPYFNPYEYRRSQQDQRHELKGACLLNFGAFHSSISYVYGSGFPIYSSETKSYNDPDYNRMDASVTYRLSKQKFIGEVGLSVLNVFDHKNVKFNSFERIPIDQINTIQINSAAMPFTPLLYLKIII